MLPIQSVQIHRRDREDLSHPRLLAEAASWNGAEYYIARTIRDDGYEDGIEWAQMVWLPSEKRGGLARGGEDDWTDAESAQDAAERFFGFRGKEMVN